MVTRPLVCEVKVGTEQIARLLLASRTMACWEVRMGGRPSLRASSQ